MAGFGSLAPEDDPAAIDPLSGVPLNPSPRARALFGRGVDVAKNLAGYPDSEGKFFGIDPGTLSAAVRAVTHVGLDPVGDRARESVSPVGAKIGQIVPRMAEGVADMATMPGRAFGSWGDAPTDQEMRDWAPGMALGMVGGARLPGSAPAGAVGAGGAKLVQPAAREPMGLAPAEAATEVPYIYHATSPDNLAAIQKRGLVPKGEGLYFAPNEKMMKAWANPDSVVFRTRQSDVKGLAPEVRNQNPDTGSLYTGYKVKPSALEVSHDQGATWAPLSPGGKVLGSGSNDAAGSAAMTAATARRPEPFSMASQVPALVKPEGIRAYHGSPHDFDRFDISKVGTGEGAQSYGHGLYFAENEGVARGYRERLQPGIPFHSLKTADLSDPVRSTARELLEGRGPEKAAARLREMAAKYPEEPSLITAADVIERAYAAPGRMYEVNINAKPDQFLDWDKPLAQQPQISESLAGLPNDVVKAWTQNGAFPHVTGQSLYTTLGSRGPVSGMAAGNPAGRVAATEALRDAGVPGIRYLDQGSRRVGGGAGPNDLLISVMDAVGGDPARALKELDTRISRTREMDPKYQSKDGLAQLEEARVSLKNNGWSDPRSRNYVVFDPGMVDILRKYALPGAIGGGAAFGSLAPRAE